MRVLIDLHQLSLQTEALAFARAAKGIDLWLGVCRCSPDQMDAVRSAFDGLIATNKILYCSLPEAATPWRLQAAEHVRSYFLASANTENIYQPQAGDDPEQSLQALTEQHKARSHPPTSTVRPRLALVAPLPPAQSGIADYCAELLPELTRYYEVELISAQASIDLPGLSVRDLAWFEEHGASFERILYHVGNSRVHAHMFALMQRFPGIVVLHDSYLGNILYALDETQPGLYQQQLFAAHGYSALLDLQRRPLHEVVWTYPCNHALIEQATGLIVHSALPCKLAERWYGGGAARDWHVIPLLRGKGHAPSRASARAQLGLADDAILVCSFGMLGPTKLNDRLLDAWAASPLALDPACQLVFVGEHAQGEFGEHCRSSAAAQTNVSITGFVDHALYTTYLAACDIAVQLRSKTRGETSAAVLDCLLHGAATIVNAHGSLAEQPDAVLIKLDDEFSTEALRDALATLRNSPAMRSALSAAGAAYLAVQHGPLPVGAHYRDSIEHITACSPKRHYQRLLRSLAGMGPALPEDLADTAQAIARNRPVCMPQQLLVDVSAMVQQDLRTGIQRVVRSILLALLADPPQGYRIEPVYTKGAGAPYQYARAYMAKSFGLAAPELTDLPIEARNGDVFLGIDLFMEGTRSNHPRFVDMRQRGVQLHFVVYDLLPLLRPAAFPYGAEKDYRTWLESIASVAHGLTCISGAVADELHTWLSAHRPARNTPLNIGAFHLGADIDNSAPSRGMPANADTTLQAIAARPSVLMVGTLEPRKGHTQALDAFDLLWKQGVDANLVIVGKNGWMMEKFAKRAAKHPEAGRRLFWLQGISDEMLSAVYAACDGLLMPSEGEGFGLPLIEAAQHGMPILARDLPVFKEVAGEHASYFHGTKPEQLAAALKDWLAALQTGSAAPSTGMAWLNWAQSAQQLLAAVLVQQWRHRL